MHCEKTPIDKFLALLGDLGRIARYGAPLYRAARNLGASRSHALSIVIRP